jgi:hypothetical protein
MNMTIQITNNLAFGGMSNNMVATMFALNNAVPRLNTAVANASIGFEGTPGTEYEGPESLFGVVPGTEPGAQGLAYASAIVTISNAWAAFWEAAAGAIEGMDNGQRGTPI